MNLLSVEDQPAESVVQNCRGSKLFFIKCA